MLREFDDLLRYANARRAQRFARCKCAKAFNIKIYAVQKGREDRERHKKALNVITFKANVIKLYFKTI